MATNNQLVMARKLLQVVDAGQSQGSLLSQAKDCIPLLEAMGYYDLADFLRGTCTTTPENVECQT